MKKIVYIFFSYFLISCANNPTDKDISNQELNKILNKSIIEYSKNKDKKVLENAYVQLSKNNDFREHGLVNGITNPAIGVLMGLGKYDELEKLLKNNNNIDKYNKANILNTVRYLKYKDKNLSKAKLYINESLEMIKDSINSKPKDSLRYIDYFSMRLFLVGKQNTLREIDSMKIANNNFSDLFYDEILKESVKSYPDEYLSK